MKYTWVLALTFLFSFVALSSSSHASICFESSPEHIEIEDSEKEYNLNSDDSVTNSGGPGINNQAYDFELPLFDDQIQLEVSTPPPELV